MNVSAIDYKNGGRPALPNQPRMATQKQFDFIKQLLTEKQLDVTATDWVPDARARAVAGNLTSLEASKLIDHLLTLPGKATVNSDREHAGIPDVPAGRYAVDTEEGHLGFYVVDRPTEGRWAGWTFVRVQASDEEHPVKGFTAKRCILTKIAADPAAASARYGRELGRCGVCGRTLTDEDSRARGIGPVCAERLGW